MSGFSVGGVVKVLDNDKALRDLQDGHGGYNAEVGKVSHLYCYICCCHDILTATKALVDYCHELRLCALMMLTSWGTKPG